jgi:hypothetical protein
MEDNNKMDPTDSNSPRRSGRERTSTTMTIQGQTVLRKNNYSVSSIGGYIFGELQEDAPRAKKAKTAPSLKNPPRVYQPSQSQLERSKHNNAIVFRARPKSQLRQAFLAHNLPKLRHFLDQSTIAKLEQDLVINAEKVQYKHQPIVTQPTAIQADMRDYQLGGLNFLVRMHRQNLAVILGGKRSCCFYNNS